MIYYLLKRIFQGRRLSSCYSRNNKASCCHAMPAKQQKRGSLQHPLAYDRTHKSNRSDRNC